MLAYIIHQLENNKKVFEALLSDVPEELIKWKPAPDKWCLLEVVCHLYDEEREDFRDRVRIVSETPGVRPPQIDPQGWVSSRKYMEQDYHQMVSRFLEERQNSINWLHEKGELPLDNYFEHPQRGKLKVALFLSNWPAHDYLHIRQITKLKYDYLKQVTRQDLNYAGDW